MSYDANGNWYDDGSAYVAIVDWCPECGGDPGPLWTPRRCAAHTPSDVGAADHVLDPGPWLSGHAEAGGEESRRFADVVHRHRVDTHDSTAV